MYSSSTFVPILSQQLSPLAPVGTEGGCGQVQDGGGTHLRGGLGARLGARHEHTEEPHDDQVDLVDGAALVLLGHVLGSEQRETGLNLTASQQKEVWFDYSR